MSRLEAESGVASFVAKAFGSIESDATECPTCPRSEVAVSPRNCVHKGTSEADDQEELLQELLS